MFKPTQFLDKPAFYRGFKDFKRGYLYPPRRYDKYGLEYLEWQRGFNYAYFQCLERVMVREGYRNKLNNT